MGKFLSSVSDFLLNLFLLFDFFNPEKLEKNKNSGVCSALLNLLLGFNSVGSYLKILDIFLSFCADERRIFVVGRNLELCH